MGLVSRARRIVHPSITDVAVLMRMGCQEGRGMFLDPWPTLNLHVLFPKRAHHQPPQAGHGAGVGRSHRLKLLTTLPSQLHHRP